MDSQPTLQEFDVQDLTKQLLMKNHEGCLAEVGFEMGKEIVEHVMKELTTKQSCFDQNTQHQSAMKQQNNQQQLLQKLCSVRQATICSNDLKYEIHEVKRRILQRISGGGGGGEEEAEFGREVRKTMSVSFRKELECKQNLCKMPKKSFEEPAATYKQNLHKMSDNIFKEQPATCEKNLRVRELQSEIQDLKRRLARNSEQEAEVEVQYEMEKEILEHAVKELTRKLADKTSEAESYATALRATIQKLDGLADQSQERLDSAFDIARSLRTHLQDRKIRIDKLERESCLRETESREARRKSAMAQSNLSKTLDARELRIIQLEDNVYDKDKELLENRKRLEDLRARMNEREKSFEKLESEMDLLCTALSSSSPTGNTQEEEEEGSITKKPSSYVQEGSSSKPNLVSTSSSAAQQNSQGSKAKLQPTKKFSPPLLPFTTSLLQAYEQARKALLQTPTPELESCREGSQSL
jgi:DNA-binding XRE family transcriptional regulator